jgi:hypothetical protein
LPFVWRVQHNGSAQNNHFARLRVDTLRVEYCTSPRFQQTFQIGLMLALAPSGPYDRAEPCLLSGVK